uniref:MyTH4 domain-containing protein n=1 Tax=Petromyzon marinus TaxID=7757 RepID=S4RI33_PETMA
VTLCSDECKVTPNTPTKDDTVKKRIVMAARDQWDTYFSRLFPAAGPIGIDIQMLAVSHKGIKLVKIVKLAGANTMYIKVLAPYSYADILYVTIANKVTLEFAMRNEQITIYSPKASQIKELVDFYCSELMRNSAYVIAVKSYFTDQKIMLSFRKGDVIKLQTAAAPMQEGARHGCVLRKTLNYFEDVHGEANSPTPPPGWKFGVAHGRSGIFPADYVQPIAPPDFAISQPEPRHESGAVAVAIASAPAATALSQRAESSSSRSRRPQSSAPESEENPYMEDLVETNPHIMVDFAKRHFRTPHRKPFNKKSRKGHESMSPADMVVFSRNPIQDSLIDIKDSNLNKQAVESFQTIMRFMGDLPPKGSDAECVYSLLRYGHQDVLKDEIYCQVIKQVTNNQSNKPDSAQKGWRLLYILTPYFKCTDVLKPYLISYLHGLASKPSPFQGMAKVCEEQLQQTLLCGGRRSVPSEVELVAMMSGRNSKRQLFNLPGGIDRFFKVKTSTVALDVLMELCKEMELSNPQAAQEYAIIALCNSGSFKKPLLKREYVMDVVAEAEKIDPAFSFWIKRVVWGQPLVLSNSLYITMHFNQVRRDFTMGHLLALPSGRPTEQHLSMVARMAALQHRAKEDRQPPSQKDMESYIPTIWFRLQSLSNWQSLISQQLNDVHGMSALQARTTFLEKMSTLPLFGSNFFNVKGSGIPPCLGAVNLKGLQFVKIE